MGLRTADGLRRVRERARRWGYGLLDRADLRAYGSGEVLPEDLDREEDLVNVDCC